MVKQKKRSETEHSASRKAELYIQRAIFEGRLRPRERVIEEDIARGIGCSRGPVREAVLRLDREGLLVVTQRRGIFVRDISREDINAIFRIRGKLEGLCVRYMRELQPAEAEPTLKRCLAEMKAGTAKRDEQALLRADLKLHRAIWRLSGQEYLYRILSSVMNPMIFMIARVYSSRISSLEETYRDHERYVRMALETPLAQVERKVEQYFEKLRSDLNRAVFHPHVALLRSAEDRGDPFQELIEGF